MRPRSPECRRTGELELGAWRSSRSGQWHRVIGSWMDDEARVPTKCEIRMRRQRRNIWANREQQHLSLRWRM